MASFAVFVMCASSPVTAQVDDDTKPFTPFRVTVIPDGILNVSMPFDVKFIVWGDVPADTTEVTFDIRRLDDDLSCSSNKGTLQQRTAVIPRKWTARDYDTHDVMDATSEIANKENIQFEVLVNELDPNAFYCMTFELAPGRPITRAEAAKLRLSLMPGFRSFLMNANQSELVALPQRQIEPLRQAFISTILAAAPRRLTPKPGTIFDPDVDRASVSQQFNNATLEVFSEHGRVRDRLSNFERGANDSVRINALVDFSQRAAAIAKTAADPALKTALSAVAALTPDQARRALYGLSATAPDASISEVWTTDFSVLPPPGGLYTADTPCPEEGELVNRCRLITERRGAVQTIRSAALGGGFPNAAELVKAADAALSALDNQRSNLLFVQNAVNARFTAMDTVLQELNEARIAQSFSQLTTTTGSASTRKAWYVGADSGIAVAPRFNEVFPYIGTAVFFRPVNKLVPPHSFGTRASFLFGFTWTDNLQKPGEREALFGEDATILLGGGLRATEWLRFTAGALVFKAIDPNPLVDDTKLKITPFFSMSADFDAADLLKNLFGANAEPPESGRVLTDK